MNQEIYEQLNQYIARDLRPRVQGDGGDLQLVAVTDETYVVHALNECSRCPLTKNCYKDWLQNQLNDVVSDGIHRIVEIHIKKPYFWDK